MARSRIGPRSAISSRLGAPIGVAEQNGGMNTSRNSSGSISTWMPFTGQARAAPMAICSTGNGTRTSRTSAPEKATKTSTVRMKTATCMARFRLFFGPCAIAADPSSRARDQASVPPAAEQWGAISWAVVWWQESRKCAPRPPRPGWILHRSRGRQPRNRGASGGGSRPQERQPNRMKTAGTRRQRKADFGAPSGRPHAEAQEPAWQGQKHHAGLSLPAAGVSRCRALPDKRAGGRGNLSKTWG